MLAEELKPPWPYRQREAAGFKEVVRTLRLPSWTVGLIRVLWSYVLKTGTPGTFP